MGTEPYYDHGGITIYHGDCREILPTLGKFDLLLTDPPYGIDHSPFRGHGDSIEGDALDFDPSHLLGSATHIVLWGASAFAGRLPPNYGWIVWDKRCGAPRQVQGDAELAWTNTLGCTRVCRHSWNGGGTQRRENGSPAALHPTQKPLGLMSECLGFFPEAKTVVDPYMGSGPVAKACKDRGLKYVGIELVEKYCEIAVKRLAQEVLFG